MKNNNDEKIKQIVKKGDSNIPFESDEEMEIYLKHLIPNQDYYINHAYNYKNFWSREKLSSKEWEFWVTLISVIITGFALASGLIGFISGNLSILVMALQITGALDIPLAIYLLTSKKIRKRNVIKKVGNKLKDLENALAFDASRNLDRSLEELKNMIIKATTPTRIYSQDSFIANIEKDMQIVNSLKYVGYENDLDKLYNLAEQYLKAKQQYKATSPADILSSNKWFKTLIEIEAKFKNSSKLQSDQNDIKEALKRMKEILIQESTRSIEQETESQSSSYQPTLTL